MNRPRADLIEEMMAWASLLQFPDVPDVPEPLRGRGFTVLHGAFLGEQGEGEALLRPFRGVGAENTYGTVPPVVLADLAIDPTGRPCLVLTAYSTSASGSTRSSAPWWRTIWAGSNGPWRRTAWGEYPDFVEAPPDASRFFDASTTVRMRRAKSVYDPSHLFRGNHRIPPMAAPSLTASSHAPEHALLVA